jgi:hypothetical protein
MNSAWLPHTILRAASFLAPGDQRAEWLNEWRSELWYIPRHEAILFSLGAFWDALWLRRNNPSSAANAGIHLESPISCLAFLAALAAVSIFITVRLPALPLQPSSPLRVNNLLKACIVMLRFSCLLLPGTLTVWRIPADRRPMPWPCGLRRGIFLALKIALVQPIMLCGFIVQILMGPLGGLAGFGFNAAFILALRWIITDQQQRCPECLRLLTNPVRIGTSSRTFLEWYGAESTCPHGHGLLQMPENSSGYSRNPEWLHLGDSWSGLFSEATEGQRRS